MSRVIKENEKERTEMLFSEGRVAIFALVFIGSVCAIVMSSYLIYVDVASNKDEDFEGQEPVPNLTVEGDLRVEGNALLQGSTSFVGSLNTAGDLRVDSLHVNDSKIHLGSQVLTVETVERLKVQTSWFRVRLNDGSTLVSELPARVSNVNFPFGSILHTDKLSVTGTHPEFFSLRRNAVGGTFLLFPDLFTGVWLAHCSLSVAFDTTRVSTPITWSIQLVGCDDSLSMYNPEHTVVFSRVSSGSGIKKNDRTTFTLPPCIISLPIQNRAGKQPINNIGINLVTTYISGATQPVRNEIRSLDVVFKRLI
jgi:hypothetical protein